MLKKTVQLRFFSRIRSRPLPFPGRILSGFRSRLSLFPCLIFLFGVLNGSLAVLLTAAPSPGDVFLYAVPGLLVSWLLLGLKESCFRFIPAASLAAVSSLLLISDRSGGLPGEMGTHDRMGAAAMFRLTDSSLCGGIPEWMPNAPRYIQTELRSAAVDGRDVMTPVSGRVLMTVPSGTEALKKAGYGDMIRAEGYFERIPGPRLRGTFDFSSYASARGNILLFHADRVEITAGGRGVLRSLYDARGRFLEKFTSGMPDGAARNMTPALLFGIRQGISGGIRDSFLRSGTLHILSVSGFHIGLFFLAVMFFLRGLPYRMRWLFAPVPVFVYAVSTGMQAPAFRAFLMLTFWCIAHAFLLRNQALNALAAAAAVLLLLNPMQLFDTGFQYSFLCVFFLLISGDFFQGMISAMNVREQFLPDRKRFSRRRMISKFAGVIGVSFVAWLCSMEISLCRQSLFSPWAVPAYLVMLPLAWYCFALFPPAVLLQWIPGAAKFFGHLCRPALELCVESAENFAEAGSLYVPPPSPWLAAVFLLSLAGIFLFKRGKAAGFCAVAMFCAGFFSLYPLPAPEPEIAVLKEPGSAVPSIVFCDPVSGTAVVLNVPGGGTAGLISDYLRTGGIGTAEEIHFESAGSDFCGGGLLLMKMNGSKSVYFHVPVRGTAKAAREILNEAPVSGSRPLLNLRKEKHASEMELRMSGFEGIRLRTVRSENTGFFLEILFPDGDVFRRKYPFGTARVMDRIPVRKRRKAEF